MKVILKRNFATHMGRFRKGDPVEMPDELFGALPSDAVIVNPPRTVDKSASERVDVEPVRRGPGRPPKVQE